MDEIKNTKTFMRIVHRYLGYFLAGIMVVYSISGILLIYRDTDFLKKENKYEKKFEPNLTPKKLGKEIKIKGFEVDRTKGDLMYFKQGTYNRKTGEAQYSKKELPFVWDKMTKLHKAESKNPLSPLNTFFGVSLFFFVLSSFWMFPPKSKIFRKGMIFAAIGFAVALFLTFL